MTQENLLSSLRALLIIVGSYVVGHNVFGRTVDASTWQILVGAIVTVASTIWGIATKTSTVEGVESAVRSIITSIGGLFVSAGVLSGDSLNAILGLITALAPAVQSALSKSKTAQIAGGQLNAQTTGKVVKAAPKVSIILLLVMIGMSAHSQSPFKSEPRITSKPVNRFARATTVQSSDSIVNAWRFSVPVSPVGYTLAGVYQASAGLAYGFQKQDYNYASQKYTVLWSLSGVVIPIQTGMPIHSIKDVANFGILVGGLTQKIGLPSNSINIGPFYNTNAPGSLRDKLGVWLTGTVNLNN